MSQSASPSESISGPLVEGAVRRKLSFDNRYIAPLFITFILVVGHLAYGILESYEKTGIAVVSAIVAELVLARVFLG